MVPKLYVGFDVRMPDAYMVAARSAVDKCSIPLQVEPLVLPHLRACRAYTRTTLNNGGVMWDEISDAPMSTQFAISRFLIPMLSGFKGQALFCDNDFLFRFDPAELFTEEAKKYAVMVVKHQYEPTDSLKMDGQLQTTYARKNWSSFIVWNCDHPANSWLTVDNVNKTTGRDLHRFCWLQDEEIGELHPEWNWLEGHSSAEINPKAVHYTRGTPDMPGHENTPYSEEWWQTLRSIT